jgi:hypothetical protein
MKYTKEFWDKQPFGEKADWRLACELDVSVKIVSRQRKLRNISPFNYAISYDIDGKHFPKTPIKIRKKDTLTIKRKYIALQKILRILENKIIDLRSAFYSSLPFYIDDSDIAEIMDCCEATVHKLYQKYYL